MQERRGDVQSGASLLWKAWAVVLILANLAVLADMTWLLFWGSGYTGFIYVFFYFPVALLHVFWLLPASLLTRSALRERGSQRLAKTCLWLSLGNCLAALVVFVFISFFHPLTT